MLKNLSSKKNEVWFNESCYSMKKIVKRNLQACRSYSFTPECLKLYLDSKKRYAEIVKNSKLQYKNEICNNVMAAKNSKQFWNAINIYRKVVISNQNYINALQWFKYFNDFYDSNLTIVGTQVSLIVNEFLDWASRNSFTWAVGLSEIQNCLLWCKNGKAAGENKIGYEFLKNLPDNWVLILNILFNRIIETETVPEAWLQILVKMLYKKKGHKKDLNNYRPIALVNYITKIFTNILCTRLYTWCEN